MTAATDHRDALIGRWLEQHATGPVLLLCAEAPEVSANGRLAVRLDGCLGQVAGYRLLDFAAAAGHPCLAVTAGCVRPDQLGPVWALAEVVGAEVLAPAGPGDGVPGPTLDAARPPVSRRGLLDRLSPPEGAAHQAVDPHGRLIESLRRAGLSGAGVASPAARLVVDGCTACGLCVRTCPHHALSLDTGGDGRARLWHDPGRCRSEFTCLAACPAAALTNAGPLNWPDALAGPRLLVQVQTRPCQRCTARTTRADGLCDHCAWRRENPFGHVVRPVRQNQPSRKEQDESGSQ